MFYGYFGDFCERHIDFLPIHNVEMQVTGQAALERRSRYYHSQIDMELLTSGCWYRGLPDAYVIFICDFDPFGRKICKKLLHNR